MFDSNMYNSQQTFIKLGIAILPQSQINYTTASEFSIHSTDVCVLCLTEAADCVIMVSASHINTGTSCL